MSSQVLSPFATTAQAAAVTAVYDSVATTHQAVITSNQLASRSRATAWRDYAGARDSVTIYHGPQSSSPQGITGTGQQRRLMLVHQTRYENDYGLSWQREDDPFKNTGLKIGNHSFHLGFTFQSPDEAETSVVALAEIPALIMGGGKLMPTELQRVNGFFHAANMRNEEGGFVLLNLDGSATIDNASIFLKFMGGKVMMQAGPDARNRVELKPLPAVKERDRKRDSHGLEIPQAFAPAYRVPPITFFGLIQGSAEMRHVILATGMDALQQALVYPPGGDVASLRAQLLQKP